MTRTLFDAEILHGDIKINVWCGFAWTNQKAEMENKKIEDKYLESNKKIIPFQVAVPFLDEIGIELISMENGEAEISLLLQERHMNSWKVAHGGVILTMLDVVMSMAGRSFDPQARAGVTVEMKTSFMQPAGGTGNRITASGRVLHRSNTLVFCEGEIRNERGYLAKALGTFKYLRRLDAGRRLEKDASLPQSHTAEPDAPKA
jgi:acyl-CoA thioesterase